MTDRVLLAAVLVLLPCACTRVALHAETPAIVDPPTAQSRADLADALHSALGPVPIRLAYDALTRDSVLVIEYQLRDRNTPRPQRFHLVTSDGHCVLVQEKTGRRLPLVNTRCRALEASR